MTFQQAVQVGALAMALATGTDASAATLTGSATASITSIYDSITVSPGTATIGSGDEFEINLNSGRAIFVDLVGTAITLRSNGVSNTAFGTDFSTQLNLTNLTFGAGIAGISVVETKPTILFSGLGPDDFGGNIVTFNANSVFVDLRNDWFGNGSVTITLTEREGEDPPVVPLPASAVLLLAGLGGLAALRRRAG